MTKDESLAGDNSKRILEDLPQLTSPDFLDKLIIATRFEHADRLKQVDGKVDDPAIEYADLLLRHYHRALLAKLKETGISF